MSNFNIEAQVYVREFLASSSRSELFDRLKHNPVWTERLRRLSSELTWYTDEYANTAWGPKGKVNPSRYTTKGQAKYVHNSLRQKGVNLPRWCDVPHHPEQSDNLKDKLNAMILFR